MKNRLIPAICFIATVFSACAQTIKPTTILPLGDSLTQADPGYRGSLSARLKESGFNVEFVGPKKADPKIPGSTAHAGHGGFTIGPGKSKADEWTGGKGNIFDNVEDWLKVQPDIVFLLIGVNEYFNIGNLQPDYQPNRDGAARLGGLLDKIHQVSPRSTVLVSSILPVGWNKDFARPLNDAIPGIVATRPFAVFADLNKATGFTGGDWSDDNLHPSELGYMKLADAWFDAVRPLLAKRQPGVKVPTTSRPKPVVLDTEEAKNSDLRVFFLGNSFTFYWELPSAFKTLAAAGTPSRKVFVRKHAEGGKTFDYYWKKITNPDEAARGGLDKTLLDPRWDVIVLQPWKDVNNDINNYAGLLISKIRETNPKVKILLYMWGDEKTETAQSQQSLFEKVANENNVTLVPVAWAWAQGQLERPSAIPNDLAWVAADGWHPGYRRTYLTAAALYATVFHESPVGLPTRTWKYSYIPPENEFKGPIRISDEEALWLQKLAWDAVRQHGNDPALKKP